ncbi:DUF674 family protein, partial [Trifolium medium]|nr:DUF674 family protein [Trifolium medium]
TSHEPLTNTILKSSSQNKDNPPNQSSSAVRAMPCTSDSNKTDIKVVQSKSQKKIIFAEVNGEFVNFIFSFLTMPLGSIVKLLGGNSFARCVGNLYKSMENMDSASVLLNPDFVKTKVKIEGGVISKSKGSIYDGEVLTALDPRSPSRSKEGVVGFVKRAALYGVGDDLTALSLLLGASLTSKSTLTSGLGGFLNVPEQESTLTSTN